MPVAAERSKRAELYMALAEARLQGLRHFEVAVAAGLDPATLSRILNRDRDPSEQEMADLAEALGKPVAELFPSVDGGPKAAT